MPGPALPACRSLASNQLTGTMPASLGSLSSLWYLCASRPRTLPAELHQRKRTPAYSFIRTAAVTTLDHESALVSLLTLHLKP